MTEFMTNFTAADMPGAKKIAVKKEAPKAKKSAPAPKVEAPVAATVEAPVEAAQIVVETPEEAPAVETKADGE
jgi:hypothetical protein